MTINRDIFAIVSFALLCSCGTTGAAKKSATQASNIKDASVNAASAVSNNEIAAASHVDNKGNFLSNGKKTKDAEKDAEDANAAESAELPSVAFAKSLKERLSEKDIDGAIDCFDEMPEALEGDVDLQVLHASLLLSSGRASEASALGDKLLASNGQSIDVLELNATIAAAQGNSKKQDDILNRILKTDPYNVSANVQKGAIEAARHKYRAAYSYYKKAVAGDGTNTDALFGMGQMAYYNGSLNESEKCFKAILEKDATNDIALAYMGKLSAESENYLRASKYAEMAIAQNPNDYGYHVDYGKYLRSLGRYDEADKAWTRAIQINSGYFLAYAHRASLRQERKQYKGALQDYYDVVRTNPKYYYAFEEVGMLEWQAGRMEECRKAFKKALEYNKDNWPYQLMVAATYIKQNNMIELKKYLAPCMKNMDRNSEEYLMMRLYFDQGPINAEMQLKNRIDKVEKANKRGKLLYYMGQYYQMRGNTDIANDFYSKVIAMQTPMFFEYQMAEWGMGM